MKKFLAILFVLALLIGLSVWEQITVNNYLDDIKTQVEELLLVSDEKTNIQTPDIINRVNILEQTWDHHEKVLCFIANHKDMRDMCMEIQKLKGNIDVNQYEDFNAGLKLISHLTDDYHYLMGLSFENLF